MSEHLSAAEHDARALDWRRLEALSPVPSTRKRAREFAQEHERCARALRLLKANLQAKGPTHDH